MMLATKSHGRKLVWLLLGGLVFTGAARSTEADPPISERVSFERDGKTAVQTGRVVQQAEDGGVLLLSSDQTLHAIQGDELRHREPTSEPFRFDGADSLTAGLESEFGDGFAVERTAHYLIVHNTRPDYARWASTLLERLYRGYFQYWKSLGLSLSEPDHPLVVVIFRDRDSYAAGTRAEMGASAGSLVSYYSLLTNRVLTYDLTGAATSTTPGARTGYQITSAIVTRPEGQHTIANIVHEATHQLACSSGLQTRLADYPLWVSEGLAIYFETPDLSNRGWGKIGAVSDGRLRDFRQAMASRPARAMMELIATDDRFLKQDSALAVRQTYAESWALVHFLMRTRKKAMLEYLDGLSKKPPVVYNTPAERLDAFNDAFGPIDDALEREFLRYVGRLR